MCSSDLPEIFPDGKFIGKQKYEDMLYARTGQTPSEFERRMRTALVADQLRKVVTDSLTVFPEEVQKALREENESFVLSYVYLNPENLKKDIATPDPLVQAYFDKNKSRYQISEKRSGKLMILDRAEFQKSTTISEAESKKYYQEHVDSFRVEERIAASHILIKADERNSDAVEKALKKVEDLSKQIQAGGNFEELAKKFSEDTGTASKGGDMGFVGKGQTAASFETVAFALPPGGVSGPVQDEVGFHLIKVRDHQNAHVRSLEETDRKSTRLNSSH